MIGDRTQVRCYGVADLAGICRREQNVIGSIVPCLVTDYSWSPETSGLSRGRGHRRGTDRLPDLRSREAKPGLRASKKPRGRGLVEAKDGGAFGLSEGPPKREGTSDSMFTENGCCKKKHFTIRDILTKRKT